MYQQPPSTVSQLAGLGTAAFWCEQAVWYEGRQKVEDVPPKSLPVWLIWQSTTWVLEHDQRQQITTQLRMLPDQALQRVAMMYKQDPYILPLVVSEDMARKKMRAAAQAQMAAASA
jgi:hypothetical protein